LTIGRGGELVARARTGEILKRRCKRRRASAFSVVLFRHLAPDSMAIVRIGVAVASAHRPIQLKTKVPDFHAGPRAVRRPALSGIAIAPQPRTASTPGKAVAPCPELGCVSSAHGTKQREHAGRGKDRQSGKHRFLPWRGSAKHLGPVERAPYGLTELGYPFHDKTVTVTTCGRICFNRQKINLSIVFAGQSVGIKQVNEHIWLVTFMDYDLGYFDHQTCRLEPLENPFGPKVLPMSPE